MAARVERAVGCCAKLGRQSESRDRQRVDRQRPTDQPGAQQARICFSQSRIWAGLVRGEAIAAVRGVQGMRPAVRALCERSTFAWKHEADLANGGEWLFDVACLQYDSDAYHRRVRLISESEWSRKIGDIWDDFEKLLVACADVRVMVFDGTILSGYDDKFEEFSAYIAKSEHTVAGDTFLLAAWMPDGFEYSRIEAFRSQHLLD